MKSSHPSEFFNNILISSTSEHKHLGMSLGYKLSYEYHFKFVLNKAHFEARQEDNSPAS